MVARHNIAVLPDRREAQVCAHRGERGLYQDCHDGQRRAIPDELHEVYQGNSRRVRVSLPWCWKNDLHAWYWRGCNGQLDSPGQQDRRKNRFDGRFLASLLWQEIRTLDTSLMASRIHFSLFF